ncbi:hypothetical protein C8R43DRAFT_1026076 [Mycena crocata]|nr:hypothetical protein C8R43DRAFT_1026076 [Mycena crocata]
MGTLPLLSFLFVSTLCAVQAMQVNHTIDDISPLVKYHAPPLDRNLTGFNATLLGNKTVTFVPATVNTSSTISMNFTGTAIYVFVAYPSGKNESSPLGFAASIDGAADGGWGLGGPTAAMYNHLAYSNSSLANGPHTLVMQILPQWELYFDYAIFSSGEPDPVPSPSATPTDSPLQTSTPEATAGPTAPSSSSASTPGPSSITLFSKHTKFPIADVIVPVVGGFLLCIVISIPFILRRRRRAKAAHRGSVFITVVPGSKDRNRQSKPTSPRTPTTPRSPRSPRAYDTYSSGAPTGSRATTTTMGGVDHVTRSAGSDPRWR